MNKNQFVIKRIRDNGRVTKVRLKGGFEIELKPFAYIKEHDILEFIPSFKRFKEIYKVFEDKALGQPKKVKIYPSYKKKEFIYLPPHQFKVIFRERKNSKDWETVRDLEKFHYRGKGLDKIVGRRTVLLAEIQGFGIVGFGIISASLPACSPRFKLLNTNFTDQMKKGIINQIVRIPRIVIHPDFRGLNLGVLMAKHLVNYARGYWDINHYKPIMVEVIAAMTDYHRFFEKAGFIKVGYTIGYKKTQFMPMYGNSSFHARDPSKYKFMENQRQKPYLVYPLTPTIKQMLGPYRVPSSITFLRKKPKLEEALIFKRLSLRYKTRNGSTDRTNRVKEVFGVDSEQAFSSIIREFSLIIEPGDVVLITGASGSGKSTILRLLAARRSLLRKSLEWSGDFPRVRGNTIEILNNNFDFSLPLIDQVKMNKNIKEAMELLNSVGLTEAHLYIKRPNQISDGQRYRFATAILCDSEKPIWIADEFVSALSPEMAAIVAKGLRKLAYRYGATLVLAAPHISYFVETLLPTKLVKLRWGTKAMVYSLKVTNFSHNKKKLSLQIVNNGFLPLTKLTVGLTAMNGLFMSQNYFDCVMPKQVINVITEVKNAEDYFALVIKTAEGVGDILYRN